MVTILDYLTSKIVVAENNAYDNGTPYWKDYGSSKNTFTLRITIISTKEEIYQSDCKICTPAVSWMNFHGTAVYIFRTNS